MPAWLRQFTIDRAALGIMVLLLVAMATRAPVDTDTWWHLRSGDYTLTQGMIHGDPFSHTQAGAVWINHSWGAQLILLAAYRLAGDAGLALYQTLLAVGGLLLLYRAGAGSVYLRAFVLIAGAAAASVFWSARPQMLSFFCTCALLWIVLTWQRGGRDRLWWLVPLLLLWGNLHAGYAIGFLFLGATLAGETLNRLTGTGGVPPAALRKLLLVTLAGAAALLINPYGLDLLLVPFQTVGIGALRAYIQEWNSPDFQGRETWPFIALVVALFGAAWGSRLKFDWTLFLLTGGTFFMALLYGRNIAVFAVVAVPVLCYHLDDLLRQHGWTLATRPRVSAGQARLNVALVALVAAGVLVYCAGVVAPATVAQAQAQTLPVAAVAYLNQAQPPGPLFNSYNWGGYLMFAAPQYPVFIDGRTDLYGPFLEVYLDTALARPGWPATLDRYGVRLVIVEATSPLDAALQAAPGWTQAYADALAVIYTR